MAPGGWSDDRWESTARHFVGIAYVAIHRICTQLQQAEFQVYRKDPRHQDGKRPVEPDHPLVKLLERPNRQDSFGKMLYRVGQQLRLTGTALNFCVPNVLGTPMEMYVIPTATAIPQPAINPDYPDGYYRIQPIYPYGPFSSYPTPSTAVGAPIPAQWMMRFQYPHPLLRYDGFSPMTGLRLHLDEVEQMDRSRWYSMKRMVNPSAVLQFEDMEGAQPLPEPEIERIRADFEQDHQGAENFGRLFVATPGAKLDKWDSNLRDMEYKDGWSQLVDFILGGGFGITKPAAGMVEDSSYATLFATLKQLNVLTLQPEVDDIANEFTRFLAPFFGDDLIVEIRCKRIDDHDLLYSKIDKMMQAKCVTKNGVLKLLGEPMTREKWGEEIAGTDSQQQQQPGGVPGMPGAASGTEGGGGAMGPAGAVPESQPGGTPAANGVSGAAAPPPVPEGEPEEVARTRPTPGKLGRGALGPRKSLNGFRRPALVGR
jgi:phage portal protein BeeE